MGDARQVKSKSVNKEANPSDCTCLVETVTVHISDTEKQESFIKAPIKVKPKNRDTFPGDLFQVIATNCLSPQRANNDYFLVGSPRQLQILYERLLFTYDFFQNISLLNHNVT